MKKDREELERDFNEEVLANHRKGVKKGYSAPIYWRMLEEDNLDAVTTAKRLGGNLTEGIVILKEKNALDLSIEKSIINHRKLFETEDFGERYYNPELVKNCEKLLKWVHKTPINELKKSVKVHWP